jgi:hypothetical protein
MIRKVAFEADMRGDIGGDPLTYARYVWRLFGGNQSSIVARS